MDRYVAALIDVNVIHVALSLFLLPSSILHYRYQTSLTHVPLLFPFFLQIIGALSAARVLNRTSAQLVPFDFFISFCFLCLSLVELPTTSQISLSGALLVKYVDARTQDNAPYIRLFLKDGRNSITATMWKEIIVSGERFNRTTVDNTLRPGTIAITSVKVSQHKGWF